MIFFVVAKHGCMYLMYTILASIQKQCTHMMKVMEGKEQTVLTQLLHVHSVPYWLLILLANNCPGQNKEETMVQFMYIIVQILKIVSHITPIFPICGYIYLPNDGDFGLIKRDFPAETSKDWIEEIKKSSSSPSSPKVVDV